MIWPILEARAKQKSYKCDNQLITWLTCITRPAGSCNLVTLKTNFAPYKNLFDLDNKEKYKFVVQHLLIS